MNRRRFLEASGMTAAGLAADGVLETALAFDCSVERADGLQLYTIRDELARDPRETLAAVAAAGFEEVELVLAGQRSVYGLSARELKDVLDGAGLRAPFAHFADASFDANALAEAAAAIGVETMVLGIPSMFLQSALGRTRMVGPRNLAELERLAALLDRLARELDEHGLRFAYHNHHVEFLPVDGRIPFDYLMEHTDPTLVQIEFDVGWLAAAGLDPVEYLRRHAARTVACHLKDFDRAARPPEDPRDVGAVVSRLVEPGAGVVDFAGVLKTLDEIGVRHAFVEIDQTEKPLEAAERGRHHLRALRAC
jgi:sugar phosphate isomerase/epimerase